MSCRVVVIAVAIQLQVAGMAAARGEECSQELETKMSHTVFASWSQIHKWFRCAGHCDDGAIAESFSEGVVHLLASRWDATSDLKRLTSTDPSFLPFVLKHIDESTDPSEVNKILGACRHRCPKTLLGLCAQIGAAAEKAKGGFERDGRWGEGT